MDAGPHPLAPVEEAVSRVGNGEQVSEEHPSDFPEVRLDSCGSPCAGGAW